MKDPASFTSRDHADAKRLRELALTRTPGHENPLRERTVIAEIIASYTEFTRAIIRGRVGGTEDPWQATDEISQEALRKLGVAKKHTFHKPLRRVMHDCMDRARKGYFRTLARQDPPKPVDTDELAVDETEALPSEEDQARAFAARLEGLSDRDRRIAIERFWVGSPPVEIARMFAISDNALAVATNRAIERLKASHAMRDVRQRRNRAA
jgi:DNA-directed RNA polymerase specialized sigma24 family protein